MIDPLTLYWRVGRKLGRTIYAIIGKEASDGDILIGVMDDVESAHHIVALHNKSVDAQTTEYIENRSI